MSDGYRNQPAPSPSGSQPPQVRGTKRAAPAPDRNFQASDSPRRIAPPATSRTRYYPANISGYVRKKTSLPSTQPMTPPHGQRSRFVASARDATFSSPASSARRAIAISAPIPVKTSQYDLPYWQVTDNASARATDSRRVAAMSVGGRSAVSTDYRNITDKTYTYSNENVRKEAGRKAARKTDVQARRSDDGSSSSESSSESSDSDDDWENVPESDKESELEKPDTPEHDDSSDGGIEILDLRPFKPPVIELLDDSPPMSPVQTPRPSAPPEDIVAAMERLTLSVECMQELHRLPFLKRNLKHGFLNYCRARGVTTESDDQAPSITVIFKLADSELPPHEAFASCYECPLCRLHRPFRTKAMLEIHLDRDHGEISTSWEEIDGDQINWRLELLFESRNEEENMSPTARSLHIETVHPESRMPTAEAIAAPPPNPFGPTSRFPFLPAKSEYGGPDLTYSVRFGGPKIYDLLGTLPMEPYGILAWAILDREEEILESDDIPDEHKVMHALWARWVTLKRNLLVAHFYNGIKQFVDDYWKMIRLAAGWEALRYWLLLLMANRFLAGREVALLLKRYENWCSEDF